MRTFYIYSKLQTVKLNNKILYHITGKYNALKYIWNCENAEIYK